MTQKQFGVVVALLLAIVVTQALPILSPSRTSPRWQYKIAGIEDRVFSDEMDSWGAAGWELVFARRAIDGGKAGYEAIFKRPE